MGVLGLKLSSFPSADFSQGMFLLLGECTTMNKSWENAQRLLPALVLVSHYESNDGNLMEREDKIDVLLKASVFFR